VSPAFCNLSGSRSSQSFPASPAGLQRQPIGISSPLSAPSFLPGLDLSLEKKKYPLRCLGGIGLIGPLQRFAEVMGLCSNPIPN